MLHLSRRVFARNAGSVLRNRTSYALSKPSVRAVSHVEMDDDLIQEYTIKALTYEMETYQRKSAERTVPWFLKNMPPQYFKDIDRDLQKDHLRALTALTEAGLAQYEEDEAQKLCEMASKGDITKIKQLINMGAHPNTGDYDGRTPFHLAASEGNLDVLKFLLSVKGANVNVVDRWGGTPLADALRHEHHDVAKWLKQKGGLKSIPSEQQDEQRDELKKERESRSLVELMLKSRTGRYITFFKPHTEGDFKEIVDSLPLDQQIARVKGFVTKDKTMLANVFEFGEINYPDRFDEERLFPQFYKLVDELQAKGTMSFRTVGKLTYSDVYERDNLNEFLRNSPTSYIENTYPERVLSHMLLWNETKGTDLVRSMIYEQTSDSLEEYPENSFWITNCASNVHPHSELVRLSSYWRALDFRINRIHLDILKDPNNGDKAIIRTLVEPPELLSEETQAQLIKDMNRMKFLDDGVLNWANSTDVSITQAEIVTSLGNMIFCVINKEHPYAYTLDRVHRILKFPEHNSIVKGLADLFYDKFNPDGPISASEFETRSEELKRQINANVQGSIQQHLLHKMLNAVDKTLRTNLFLEDRMILMLRVDPSIMLHDDSMPTPYGVFFGHGRRSNGFQARFRDIARGGLRVVPTDGSERFGQEAMRHFDEVYGLAFAQQLKNKDIPEGGSKAVLLVNVADRTPDAKDFLVRKSVRCFTDGLLDLSTPDPATRDRMVDYWGKPELIYLGPDENIIPEDIMWVTERARKRGMLYPNAFMSSKPDAGINHKVYGVTSEGVAVFLRVALGYQGFDVEKDSFTVKITGGPNGDVAGNMIKILRRDYPGRAKIVGMVDHTGGVEDPTGLDMEELYRLHIEDLPIGDYDDSKLVGTTNKYAADNAEGLALRNTMHNRMEADAFIPAGGRPNTININNWNKFFKEDGTPTAPLIVEAANIFTTPEARKELGKRGVAIVKDSSANKCGVMCSSYEIVASMILSGKQEFMDVKEELVEGVLEILRQKARTEAELLFREYRQNPVNQLPSYSQSISEAINRCSDAVIDALTEDYDRLDAATRRRLMIEALPPKLVEVAGDRLEDLPQAYIISMMGAALGSKMVYNEGLDYIDSLSTESLVDFATKYVTEEDKVRAFITDLQDSGISSKEQIIKILKTSGVKSVLAAGL